MNKNEIIRTGIPACAELFLQHSYAFSLKNGYNI